MVFGFALGQRRRIPEDPCVVARNEVRFWKTELDRCVEEKQQWIERCANAARQNEVLRTEVYLLQQDVSRLQDVLSLTPGSSQTQVLTPIRPVKMGNGLSPLARMPLQHTPGSEDGPSDFLPASMRYQSPCSADTKRQLQALQEEAARWRDEANSLRKYLQEARALNDSLRQQVGQQQHRAEFLRSTAEAYKNQAQQLQDKLMTQHGINDETADETVKLLADLSRLQQSNALLTRDLALKDGMIHLLQQQLAEQLSKPVTPRTGRSPERNGFSRCSHSPDCHASPRGHVSPPEVFTYAHSAAGTSDGAPTFHSHSGTVLADDSCTFHTTISEPSEDGHSVQCHSLQGASGTVSVHAEAEAQPAAQFQALSELPQVRTQLQPQSHSQLPPRPQPQTLSASNLQAQAHREAEQQPPGAPSHVQAQAEPQLRREAFQPRPQAEPQPQREAVSQLRQPVHTRRRSSSSGGVALSVMGRVPSSVGLGPLEGADLELAGLVAVHAAMYSIEKDTLKQSQQQLESAVAAARYEVAAHETSWDQVLDGLTAERVNSMAARWAPPKPRSKEAAQAWDASQGPCNQEPCVCGRQCGDVTLHRLREAAAATAAAGKSPLAVGSGPLRQQKLRRPPKAKAR